MVAPATSAPTATSTGTGSPVSIDWSTAEAPSTTTPSVAIFSPGRTTNVSPTSSCSTGTSTSAPSRNTRASLAPNASKARIAAPDRRFARVSKKRPSRISAVITADTSKYIAASSPPSNTTVDHVQAASVPTDTSVSIVAAPCRAFSSAARWNCAPDQNTTGVASASETHSQPVNCSGGIIAISTSGAARTSAAAKRAGGASCSCACPARSSCLVCAW